MWYNIYCRKVKTVAPYTEREVMPMGNSSKSDGKEERVWAHLKSFKPSLALVLLPLLWLVCAIKSSRTMTKRN